MKILKVLMLLVPVYFVLSYVNLWGAYIGEFNSGHLLIVILGFVALKRFIKGVKGAFRAFKAQVRN